MFTGKIIKVHQGTICISSKLGRFCCSIFLDVLFTMIMFENFIASERRVLKIDFNESDFFRKFAKYCELDDSENLMEKCIFMFILFVLFTVNLVSFVLLC